jgi:transcriptional regulator with XRE-family HTH domain
VSDPILQALGARIRTLREHREMTQADLALAVGLSRTSVTNLEAGRQGDVPATKLVAIGEALGANVGALLGEVPMPDLPLVQVITSHSIECDRCGLVQDGLGSASDADEQRRMHLRGHVR